MTQRSRTHLVAGDLCSPRWPCSVRSRSTRTCRRSTPSAATSTSRRSRYSRRCRSYLFAYAFMMLWHGALADALGRRPVVLAGLAIFAITSLGCAIAGNIETLWLFRALQGVCAGSGHGRRTGDHSRPLPWRRRAAPDVADHAVLRDRAGGRAGAGRRAAQHAGLALDLLGDAGSCRSRCWSGRCARLPRRCPFTPDSRLPPRRLWRNYVERSAAPRVPAARDRSRAELRGVLCLHRRAHRRS